MLPYLVIASFAFFVIGMLSTAALNTSKKIVDRTITFFVYGSLILAFVSLFESIYLVFFK